MARAARDIKTMRVRGATAIARLATEAALDWSTAYGREDSLYSKALSRVLRELEDTRRTGVPLYNALTLVRKGAARGKPGAEAAARRFLDWSKDARSQIAPVAARLIPRDATVLTHCNSQAAIGSIIAAHRAGRRVNAIATETRPWRQGIMTARSLAAAGVPTSLIVDSAAGHAMAEVDVVVVGADAVATNGDAINKIGTRLIAAAAERERVPFYVCSELFKVDLRAKRGRNVEIEEREAAEIVDPKALPGVRIKNPVFDVTPADCIDAFVTEKGKVNPSGIEALARQAFHDASLMKTRRRPK